MYLIAAFPERWTDCPDLCGAVEVVRDWLDRHRAAPKAERDPDLNQLADRNVGTVCMGSRIKILIGRLPGRNESVYVHARAR